MLISTFSHEKPEGTEFRRYCLQQPRGPEFGRVFVLSFEMSCGCGFRFHGQVRCGKSPSSDGARQMMPGHPFDSFLRKQGSETDQTSLYGKCSIPSSKEVFFHHAVQLLVFTCFIQCPWETSYICIVVTLVPALHECLHHSMEEVTFLGI